MTSDLKKNAEKRRRIANQLRDILDPEIGMSIVDVGLIYDILIDENDEVIIKMTLTTPGCPLTDYFLSEIETKLIDLEFVNDVRIDFVWAPQWDLSMMNEEAKQDMFRKF